MMRWFRRSEGGFTLIELVVVLAILGLLIALAVPRYLGSRRGAIIAEGDNILHELKALAWAYYQQYSSWDGVTGVNMASTFGFVPPGGGCWLYDLAADATPSQIRLRASADPSGPTRCTPVGGIEIMLILNSNGSSARSVSGF